MSTDDTTVSRNFGLAAVFEDTRALRETLADLHDAGVPAAALTVLGPRGQLLEGVAPAPETPHDLAEEIQPWPIQGMLGTLLGAYAGLWGNLLLLAIPGVGPAVAAGGAAALLATTATGMGLGGVLALILNENHTARHWDLYQEAIERGGWVLVVHGTPDEYELAEDVLRRHRPSHLDPFVN